MLAHLAASNFIVIIFARQWYLVIADIKCDPLYMMVLGEYINVRKLTDTGYTFDISVVHTGCKYDRR